MSGLILPGQIREEARVIKQLEKHLGQITSYFENPYITLIVRNPAADRGMGEGDMIMTLDDLDAAINALENWKERIFRQKMNQQSGHTG